MRRRVVHSGRLPRYAHPLLALVAGAFAVTGTLAAQRPLLARADSAWRSGDRVGAQRLYGQVLDVDSNQSRAVFRLAQLEDSPRQALPLYRRYVRLERYDPWGFMAMGDALSDLGRFREALLAYDHAERLLPGERDAAVGRARTLGKAGRPEEAAGVLSAWVATHKDDAEVWELLGRERLRSGRARAATAAFERAQSLGRSRQAASRIALARALSAPAVEPTSGYQRDSDGNETTRLGVMADMAPIDGARIALGVQRAEIADLVESSHETEGFLRLTARPRSNLQLFAQGGAAHFDGNVLGAAWSSVEGSARLRLRAPLAGPALELRAQRTPLGTSPLLVATRALRTEGRITVDVPVGPVRLRGTGRSGYIAARGEGANGRQGGDLALAIPLGGRVEVSGQYHRLGYERSSRAGYFAPRFVETREAGVYFETGDDRITVAADLGAGAQHVAQQNAAVGAWTRALRGWAYVTVPIAQGRALWFEAEGYDAPFAPEGVTTSASWRFLALSFGVRWSLH